MKRKTNWTKLCLSRSAAASIDVHFYDCSLSRLDDVRPHVHRFKEFHFDNPFDDASLVTVLSPLFDSDMSLLQKLQFGVRVLRQRTPTSQIDAQITSQRFTSLRTLTLTSTIMVAPQEISLYAQLRELTLDGCPPPLSFDGFLDALAASVQLEELHLRPGTLHHLSGEWPRGGPGSVPHRPLVSLPRLRAFALYEYRIDRISCFLAHLYLRPSVVLWIQGCVSGEIASRNTIDAMLPPNRSAALPVLGLATNAHVTAFENKHTISCGYVGPQDDLRSGDPPPVVLKLDPGFRAGEWSRSTAQGLDDLVQSFGPSPLASLTVTNGHTCNATATAWERVFRTFPGPLLEELRVGSRKASSDVSNVFRGLHAASTTHTDSIVACAKLKKIIVEGVASAATYEAMRDCFRYLSGDRRVVLESLNTESLIDQDDIASGSRLRFIMSGVVKSIEAGHGLGRDEGWPGAAYYCVPGTVRR